MSLPAGASSRAVFPPMPSRASNDSWHCALKTESSWVPCQRWREITRRRFIRGASNQKKPTRPSTSLSFRPNEERRERGNSTCDAADETTKTKSFFKPSGASPLPLVLIRWPAQTTGAVAKSQVGAPAAAAAVDDDITMAHNLPAVSGAKRLMRCSAGTDSPSQSARHGNAGSR